MKKKVRKATFVVLMGFLLVALILVMTSCPSAVGPGDEDDTEEDDPSEGELTKLLASDGAGFDRFGGSVSIDGDYAIVGADGDDSGTGAAYIFVRGGAGWTQQAKLTASDGASSDHFGCSVSIDGDYAIVGAYGDDDLGSSSGSAYVFLRDDAAWTQQAKLTAYDGAAQDRFGGAVSISGTRAIVGAAGDDNEKGENRGSVYVFVRSGATWSPEVRIIAFDGGYGDEFGDSVCISGDEAIVGAHCDDINVGAAYIYVRDASGWSRQAKLIRSGSCGNYFGESVSIDGDYAIGGTYVFGDNRVNGKAHIFVRNGTDWTEQAVLTASDGDGSDYFGHSVCLSGDRAIIGAHGDEGEGPGEEKGSAYLFVRSGDTWTEQAKFTASDGAAMDSFSWSVSISADRVIMGAPGAWWDGGQDENAGSAYIYD